METLIYDANIEEREGVFYCQILRDINTPMDGAPTDNFKLVNGRKLRGLYLELSLKFDEQSNAVSLSNIIVVSTPSERSK